jgi:glycosyltransferase involved in cell wall biosynthesis
MNLAYLIPEGQYTFFRELVAPLEAAGIRVDVNRIADDADVILAGILPITHEWLAQLERTDKPFVLWHWDLYSFTDYSEPRWERFLDLLPRAAQIWSCTYEVARQLKERERLDSLVVPAWVREPEMVPCQPGEVGDYVFYAASGCGFGKRTDWAERACKIADLPLRLLTGQKLPRGEYLDLLRRCRVYLMPAFEESNGTIPALEAMACGRPVVCSDLPASREVFGNCARYFPPNDFWALVGELEDAWHHSELAQLKGPREQTLADYGLASVVKAIGRNLRWCHAGA